MAQAEYVNYSKSRLIPFSTREHSGKIPNTTLNILDKFKEDNTVSSEKMLINEGATTRIIEVTAKPNFVSVEDNTDEHSRFICSMRRIPYQDIKSATGEQPITFPDSQLTHKHQLVCLLFKTKHDNQYHPYLYASELFRAQFTYLLRHGPIDAVLGRWIKDIDYTTNYDAYQATFNELSVNPYLTDEHKKELAAFSTWTGKRVKEFGFTKAFVREKQVDKRQQVFALFTR